MFTPSYAESEAPRAQRGASRKGDFFYIVSLDPAYPAHAGRGTCRSRFLPWMNAMRVPYEALEERSGVCFGGFRPRSMWRNRAYVP